VSLDPVGMTAQTFVRADLEALGFNPRARSTLENLPQDQDAIIAAIDATRDELNTVETGAFVVWQPTTDKLTDTRVIADSDNVTLTADGSNVLADLTDTGIVAGDYGSQTRILILTTDAKGRISAAQEVKMDVSDVDGILKALHGGTGQSGYTVAICSTRTRQRRWRSCMTPRPGMFSSPAGSEVRPVMGR
jgi:DNA-binding cell septation regulator SpoVG